MKTGRPRIPTALKLVRGTQRADRLNVNEPKPKLGIPPVPAQLSDEAKAEWERLAPELFEQGVLCPQDGAALAALCEFRADFLHASTMCATKDGQDRKVIKTANGNFQENPYYSIKKRSAELMYKFLTEFGLTPASRSRLNATPPQEPQVPSRWKNFGG
jgi:P27 family predicted phage terminase small subunit